jgi:endogenous inhibitor of DNA gyrase (YacG/DUF329 family)
MDEKTCSKCGTNESKAWMKANEKIFCSKKCQEDAGEGDSACEFC